MATQRESSRKEWNSSCTVGDINAGSLQRIADATELMARRYQDLIDDRDWYKCRYDQEVAKSAKLQRQVNAYRGIFNRKKKR